MAVQASLFSSDTNNLLGVPNPVSTAGWMMTSTCAAGLAVLPPPDCSSFPNTAGTTGGIILSGLHVNGGSNDLDLVMMNDRFGQWEDGTTTVAPSAVLPQPSTQVNLPHSRFSPAAAAALFPDDDELAKQRSEVDFLLQLQSQRLKLSISQQRNQQVATLLYRIDTRLTAAIRTREQDLLRVGQRTKELEDWLHRTEVESAAWQKVARESESMIMGLTTMLRPFINEQEYCGGPVNDAESVCEYGGDVRDTARSSGQRLRREGTVGLGWCRCCGMRRSCLVFLPCKHLCACMACGTVIGSCPVCRAVKEACIEVIL